MTATRHYLLAAGGTGGHMLPAYALAGELISRGHRVALVSDDRGFLAGWAPEGTDQDHGYGSTTLALERVRRLRGQQDIALNRRLERSHLGRRRLQQIEPGAERQ